MMLRLLRWMPIVLVSLLPLTVTAFDGDDDGVDDNYDECPQTKAGVKVGRDGCAMAPAEAACPPPPAGALVDERGCALDTDGDGIADGLDLCPQTTPGLAVDAQGCVPVVKPSKKAPTAAKKGVKKIVEPLPPVPEQLTPAIPTEESSSRPAAVPY